MSMNLSRLSVLVLTMVFLAMTAACKDAEPAQWRKVDAGVARSAPDVDPADVDKLKAERAKRHIDNMKNAFVFDAEKTCTSDADCVVTTEHCCTCAQGGRKVAVNQSKLPDAIRRRAIVCRDYACTERVSDDASCEAELAKCVEGVCQPQIPEGAKAPEGVGVEPIEGTGDEGDKGDATAPSTGDAK